MRLVTFLRHGRSLADDEQKFEGRYDSPLTEVGRAQAKRLAADWQADEQRRYDLIVCSPLLRAAETAGIVGESVGCEPLNEPLWMERDNGRLAGLTFEEGNGKYPRPEFTDRYTRIAGGTGESSAGLHGRAALATEDLMNRTFGRALVVAHGGILQAAARCVLGIALPLGDSGAWFWFRDLSHLDIAFEQESDRWTVVEFGHLSRSDT
jgi:2,3-bisphosphoglycerate-dependent phosphoglycerate mutase